MNCGNEMKSEEMIVAANAINAIVVSYLSRRRNGTCQLSYDPELVAAFPSPANLQYLVANELRLSMLSRSKTSTANKLVNVLSFSVSCFFFNSTQFFFSTQLAFLSNQISNFRFVFLVTTIA